MKLFGIHTVGLRLDLAPKEWVRPTNMQECVVYLKVGSYAGQSLFLTKLNLY